MSCSPWQSVQTAATPEPAATALPCTLSWYDVKGAELTPDDAITNFWPWHAPQVCGMLARATFDFGSLAGRDLMHAAVAILAFRHIGVARGCGLGVDTVIVSSLLISVTGGADWLGRRWFMRKSLDVGVTVGTAEGAVD